jgi:hypothetical protein
MMLKQQRSSSSSSSAAQHAISSRTALIIAQLTQKWHCANCTKRRKSRAEEQECTVFVSLRSSDAGSAIATFFVLTRKRCAK